MMGNTAVQQRVADCMVTQCFCDEQERTLDLLRSELQDHLIRKGLGKTEVTSANLPEMVGDKTRTQPHFDPELRVAQLIEHHDDSLRRSIRSGVVPHWPEPGMACEYLVRESVRDQRLAYEVVAQRVMSMRAMQEEDPRNVVLEICFSLARAGLRRLRLTRDQVAEYLPEFAREHPRFDAGACFDAALAWLRKKNCEQYEGGPTFISGQPQILIRANGDSIVVTARPRWLPSLFWRLHVGRILRKNGVTQRTAKLPR